MLIAELDPAAALHLAHALRAHRAWCAEKGYALPPVVEQLERDADLARHGQIRPFTRAGRDDEQHDLPPVLTRPEFAKAAGRSERTVRRWIADGRVVEGIPRTELRRVKGTRRAA